MSLIRKATRNANNRERSLLYKSNGKDHILATSQKAGLTVLYKKFLFMSTTAISKLFFFRRLTVQ